MPTIPELQQRLQQLHQERSDKIGQARALAEHGKLVMAQIDAFFAPRQHTTQERLVQGLQALPVEHRAVWHDTTWNDWLPRTDTSPPAYLRYGTFAERKVAGSFAFPALAPFVGGQRTIVLRSKTPSAQRAQEVLQSLLIRSAALLPHQVGYTLLDPAGNGIAFPMRRFLPHVSPVSDDARRDLDQVSSEIRRIIETYLDASVTTFEHIPEEMRLNERYHLIFAADFPNKYDRRAIEALYSIGNTGPRAGVYLFIHYNQAYELPRDLGFDGLKNAYVVDIEESSVTINGIELERAYDTAPLSDRQDLIFQRLKASEPVELKINWDNTVGLPESAWWQSKADRLIELPVGRRGNNELLKLWFGVRDGRPCVHGIIGGMSGAGKSTLYHTLIAGLVTRYSPEELRLYLIDGKDGVEFQPYMELPHAEVVSLHTSAELSRSVLAELADEMTRRNEVFVRHGVSDLSGYRERGQPSGSIPRVLLIIDEYQQLFEDDRDGVASRMMRTIAEKGRSAGIHMLLGSQRFGASGMLDQTAIFGNIHLRSAMKMAESDVRALTEFGPKGKQLILATCNLPGKIVINDDAGDDKANVAGKVAFLEDERRTDILQAVAARAQQLPIDRLPQRVVFNGAAQPELTNNPHLVALLRSKHMLSPLDLEERARRPVTSGGFQLSDWYSSERPSIAWVGQEFNVRGQAVVVLRRKVDENIALVGSNSAARYAMIAAMMVSLAATAAPDRVQFLLGDRSVPGAQWDNVLTGVCNLVLAPSRIAHQIVRDSSQVETLLQQVSVELDRRRTILEARREDEPSLYLILTEPDNVENLRRRSGGFGMSESPIGDLFQRIYAEGPPLGIHVIVSCSGVRPLTSVIDDRRNLPHFRHRIALQMSENESFDFVRNRRAAQLQSEGPVPICALYVDTTNDRATRFKPYTSEQIVTQGSGQRPFLEQLRSIGTQLADRK